MPRTKEQNKKILEKRKQEILICAINVFSAKDIKSATVDDITKKLKISHGLFYHYFKNKEDLIKNILAYAKDTIIVEFEKIALTNNGVGFFEKFFGNFLKLLQNRENALLINLLLKITKEVILNKKIKNGNTEFEIFHENVIYKNLSLLNAQGKLLQPVESTSRLLYVLIDGIVDLVIENKLKKTNITAKSVLRTFIKYTDY